MPAYAEGLVGMKKEAAASCAEKLGWLYRIDPELRALEEENERLKRIIARQALEIEFKSELLKKSPVLTKTRR